MVLASPSPEVVNLMTERDWRRLKKSVRTVTAGRRRPFSWGSSLLSFGLSAGLALVTLYAGSEPAVAPLALLWAACVGPTLLGAYLLHEDRHESDMSAAAAERLRDVVREIEESWKTEGPRGRESSTGEPPGPAKGEHRAPGTGDVPRRGSRMRPPAGSVRPDR